MPKAKQYDVIQIHPNHELGGCLGVVEEIDASGVQCYVEIPSRGRVNCRVSHKEYAVIGKAAYVLLWVDDEEVPVPATGELALQIE